MITYYDKYLERIVDIIMYAWNIDDEPGLRKGLYECSKMNLIMYLESGNYNAITNECLLVVFVVLAVKYIVDLDIVGIYSYMSKYYYDCTVPEFEVLEKHVLHTIDYNICVAQKYTGYSFG